MKKIIFLFFSFLGICKGFAQQLNSNGATSADTVAAAVTLQKEVADTAVTEKPSVKLYPNPAKNKVELEVRGFEPGLIQLQVINLNGKTERNDQRLLTSGTEIMVVMFSLPAGIYFIVLRQKDKLVKKKLLVQ